MKHLSKQVDINQLSPFVRYIHFDNINSNNFYLPQRIIYDYELCFIVEGDLDVITNNNSYHLNAGDLHFMEPFVRHYREIPKNSFCKYYSVHFDFFHITGVKDDINISEYTDPCNKRLSVAPINTKLLNRMLFVPKGFHPPKKIKMKNPELVLSLLSEMLEDFKSKDIGYQIALKANMLKIFQQVMLSSQMTLDYQNSTETQHKSVVSEICLYIHNNYAHKINFADISKEFGFSSSYLRKIFHQVTGQSLIEYLTQVRIEKAKKLLAQKKLTISEISLAVGYPDVQSFSRAFKQQTGSSPIHFQQRK